MSDDIVKWLRAEYHNRGQMGHSAAADLIECLQAELTAERERAERNEKDCEAAKLYGSTARGMGFVGVPAWAELAEDTKDIYRRAAKDGALGK